MNMQAVLFSRSLNEVLVHFPDARFVRVVCWLIVLAGATSCAFFAGYRLGFLDGLAQLDSVYDGVPVRMVPIE